MKPLSVATAFLLVVFTFSGCASSESTTRSQDTISTMDAVQKQLNGVNNQVDKTQSALDNVANSSESELEDAYDSFGDQISNLMDRREELNERINEMEQTGDDYLSNWQSEAEGYNNPELRSDSRDRRDELRRLFQDVQQNSSELNQALKDYIADVREIRSYLSNDLTQSGADAVGSSRQQERSARQVRNAIDRFNDSISEAKDELGAGGPASSE